MGRIAVVLGAGGTVGHAFHAGVLTALSTELGWDARRADFLVGTSAGSIVAALLRAGLPPSDLLARGSLRPLSPEGAAIARRAGLGPPRPRPARRRAAAGMASPAQLARAARAPWSVTPGALAAAVLPAGQIPTDDMAVPFDNLFGATWPVRPTWIVAVQLDAGRRVAFGRAGAPEARLADAVRASCAIPAFFEPVEIGGERYVDGGVHSTTNSDLVGGLRRPADLVLVSAPMSAARGATGSGPMAMMRQYARLSLAREVAGLRARGIPVVTFQPTSAELEVMSGDSLDPANFAPVAAQTLETTTRRLARSDVRQRLAALVS
jgi:NTE family protein